MNSVPVAHGNQLDKSPFTGFLPFPLSIPHSSAGVSWDHPMHQLLAVDTSSLGQLLEEPILRDLQKGHLFSPESLAGTGPDPHV